MLVLVNYVTRIICHHYLYIRMYFIFLFFHRLACMCYLGMCFLLHLNLSDIKIQK